MLFAVLYAKLVDSFSLHANENLLEKDKALTLISSPKEHDGAPHLCSIKIVFSEAKLTLFSQELVPLNLIIINNCKYDDRA